MATNDVWLAKHEEKVLDPERPIIDPHHHLWDFRREGVAPRYLLDDLLEDTNSGHNIVSTVFIECGTMFRADADRAMAPLGETEFANGQAAMSASDQYGGCRVAEGIIGTAYLSDGDSVAEVLDAQLAASPERFRGIRQAVAFDEDPAIPDHRTQPPAGRYLDKQFRLGFAHLAPRSLTFEAWCYHTQISELTDLARAFPDTTIILDHFGGPLGIGRFANQKDQVYAAWLADVTELATCPNVYAKLGGLAMEVNGYNWHHQDTPPDSTAFMQATRRYYEKTIELFGVDRCMFESNFPVDKISVSYRVLWNSFKRFADDYSEDEKNQLFHDTAARVYRLRGASRLSDTQ